MKHITQKPNLCPKCRSAMIDWHGSRIEGDYYIYSATCQECACEFTEIYELKFIEQKVTR